MRKVNIKNLTPKETWEKFVQMSEEMFLSNFRPETNIKKMCKIYAQELPIIFESNPMEEGILFTGGQLEEIEDLLITHLEGYIKNKGGIENIKLYTEEELEEIQRQQYETILDGLSQKLGVSREEIKKELRERGQEGKGSNKKYP